MREFYDVFRATLSELGKAVPLDRLETHVNHRITIQDLSKMLETAGFSIRRVHEDTFSLRFLDGSAMFRHTFMQIGFLDAWKSVLQGEDERDVFLALESKLNRLAERKGELELTIPMAYIEAEKVP